MLTGAGGVVEPVPEEHGHRARLALGVVGATVEDELVLAERDRAVADGRLEQAVEEPERRVLRVATELLRDVVGGDAVALRLDARVDEERHRAPRVGAGLERGREVLLGAREIADEGEAATPIEELCDRRSGRRLGEAAGGLFFVRDAQAGSNATARNRAGRGLIVPSC